MAGPDNHRYRFPHMRAAESSSSRPTSRPTQPLRHTPPDPAKRFQLTPNKKYKAKAAAAASSAARRGQANNIKVKPGSLANSTPLRQSIKSRLTEMLQPDLVQPEAPAPRPGPDRFELTANKKDVEDAARAGQAQESVAETRENGPSGTKRLSFPFGVGPLLANRLFQLTDQEFLTVAEHASAAEIADLWKVSKNYVASYTTLSIRREAKREGLTPSKRKATLNERRKVNGVIMRLMGVQRNGEGPLTASRSGDWHASDLPGYE